MESVTLSWLVLACSCPLPILLLLSCLYIFHSYRKRWSNVHLFIVCLTSVELVSCLFLFSYSLILLLIRPSFPPVVCTFFTWGFVSIRLLQVLILVSMCADRVLFLHSPQRYRVSGNQIRYHVVVLILLCSCVGMTGIFSRISSSIASTKCLVFSTQWPFPFAVLYAGILTFSFGSHMICALLLCFYKLSSRVASVARPLNQCSVVFATTFSCYAVHHLPYLVISIFILFMLPISSPWLENGFAWLSFADSLSLPAVLVFADKTHWSAFKKIFHGPSVARHSFGNRSLLAPVAESCDTFQYVNELSEAKVFPRRLIDTNIGAKGSFKIYGGVSQETFVWRSSFHQHQRNRVLSNQTGDNILMQPVFTIDTFENNSLDTRLSLSNGSNSIAEYSDDDSSVCGSVAANEDFEFHNIRPLPVINDKTYQVISDKNRANTDTWSKGRNRLSLSLNDLDQIDKDLENPDMPFEKNVYVHEAVSESNLHENERYSLPQENFNRDECEIIGSKIGEKVVITELCTSGEHLNLGSQFGFKKIFITKYL